MAAISVSVE